VFVLGGKREISVLLQICSRNKRDEVSIAVNNGKLSLFANFEQLIGLLKGASCLASNQVGAHDLFFFFFFKKKKKKKKEKRKKKKEKRKKKKKIRSSFYLGKRGGQIFVNEIDITSRYDS